MSIALSRLNDLGVDMTQDQLDGVCESLSNRIYSTPKYQDYLKGSKGDIILAFIGQPEPNTELYEYIKYKYNDLFTDNKLDESKKNDIMFVLLFHLNEKINHVYPDYEISSNDIITKYHFEKHGVSEEIFEKVFWKYKELLICTFVLSNSPSDQEKRNQTLLGSDSFLVISQILLSTLEGDYNIKLDEEQGLRFFNGIYNRSLFHLRVVDKSQSKIQSNDNIVLFKSKTQQDDNYMVKWLDAFREVAELMKKQTIILNKIREATAAANQSIDHQRQLISELNAPRVRIRNLSDHLQGLSSDLLNSSNQLESGAGKIIDHIREDQ